MSAHLTETEKMVSEAAANAEKASQEIMGLPYVYRWNRQDRKGQPCEVLIRTKVMNSCLVRFGDGYTMVTSRNALMKNRAALERSEG